MCFQVRMNPKNNAIVQEYILPDLSTNQSGRIRQPDDMVETDQILVMNNERFTVPELLFRPDDIGLDQAGLAATISFSISLLPSDLQGMFWANIGLIGGTTKFSGFRERLLLELQCLAPVECEVVIYDCSNPITEAYHSAYQFVNQPGFTEHVVTRAEYAEYGSNASRKKFRDWKPQESEKEKPKEAPSKVKGKQREDDRTQASTTRMTKTRNKLGTGTPTTNNSSTRKISLRSSHPPQNS